MSQEGMVRNRSIIVFTATLCPPQTQELCVDCQENEPIAAMCTYFDGSASAAHRNLPDYAEPSKEVDQMLEKLIAAQKQGKFRVQTARDVCIVCLRALAVEWTGKPSAASMIDGLADSHKPVTIVGLWIVGVGLHGQLSTALIAGKGRLTPVQIVQQLRDQGIYEIGNGGN